MKIAHAHRWDLSPAEAINLQREMASSVVLEDRIGEVNLVAGADLHFPQKGRARAAVVVLSYPDLKMVESRVAEGEAAFPYIPGLLAFRESPLVLEAFGRLLCSPDLLLVDGQGVAHPRRMGLACHLGIYLDIPTIGCAKSRLYGRHTEPGLEKGSWADLMDNNAVIGSVLRTKNGVRPLYVSPGHLVGIEGARAWTLKCCRGYRVPEPTRLAHQLAGSHV
ncbi:MAG: deoxyribonuclease V [Dehalococcoidia bacterium]|nr:deoxyribonuclease V [Dehalococcoidia bacterium]